MKGRITLEQVGEDPKIGRIFRNCAELLYRWPKNGRPQNCEVLVLLPRPVAECSIWEVGPVCRFLALHRKTLTSNLALIKKLSEFGPREIVAIGFYHDDNDPLRKIYFVAKTRIQPVSMLLAEFQIDRSQAISACA